MITNFECKITGEPCWNVKVLKAYADRVSLVEKDFMAVHLNMTVLAGKLACEGKVVNIFGRGEVCLAWVEPTQVTYFDQQLELPGMVSAANEIPGFKFVKPDGSWLHQLLKDGNPLPHDNPSSGQ